MWLTSDIDSAIKTEMFYPIPAGCLKKSPLLICLLL